MTNKEYKIGLESLNEAMQTPLFVRALTFIYRSIPATEVDLFSENPYRNAYLSGQRSVGHLILDLVGKDHKSKLFTTKLG